MIEHTKAERRPLLASCTLADKIASPFPALHSSLEFEPRIATHKMNQAYRSPRYKTEQIINLVRLRVVIDQDVAHAVEELCNINVVQKHLAGKNQRQRQDFRT